MNHDPFLPPQNTSMPHVQLSRRARAGLMITLFVALSLGVYRAGFVVTNPIVTPPPVPALLPSNPNAG
jgi:hypothetical protein